MKSNCRPYLIGENGNPTALERVPLKGSEISEGFLQGILDRNPALLPVSRFGSGFGPLTSLGREIMNIDNLFITPTGRLTVVETKLWRNPQATRHVLAQMLDYASRLSSLSYEEFEQRCQAANQSALSSNSNLYQLVYNAFPEEVPDEAEFVDQVQRGLKNGRFLLLVVGDGIREGLEQVLDALHRQSRLHFTFGLVELQLYEYPGGNEKLAIPQVVAHSTEIERAVVTVRGAESVDVQVEVRSGPDEKAPRLTEREFLESIEHTDNRRFAERIFDWARENASIHVVAKSAAIRVPFSTTRNGLIIMRIFRSGRVYVTPPKLQPTLRNAGVQHNLALEIAERLKDLFPRVELRQSEDSVIKSMRAEQLLKKVDDVVAVYQAAAERAREIDPDPGADAIIDASSEDDENSDFDE